MFLKPKIKEYLRKMKILYKTGTLISSKEVKIGQVICTKSKFGQKSIYIDIEGDAHTKSGNPIRDLKWKEMTFVDKTDEKHLLYDPFNDIFIEIKDPDLLPI